MPGVSTDDPLPIAGRLAVGRTNGNAGRSSRKRPRSGGWSANSTPRNWPSARRPRRNCSAAGRPSSICCRRPAIGTPPKSEQRLGRIRQKLQQQAAEAAAESSTITLQADAMPLANVLAAFQRQSGNTIVDGREKFGQPATDPKLKVRLRQDALLAGAGSLVGPGRADGLSVFRTSRRSKWWPRRARSRLARVGRACYVGPFRIEPVGRRRPARSPPAGRPSRSW